MRLVLGTGQAASGREETEAVTIQLRDYQLRAVDQLREAYLRGRRAPLLQSPTGSGKSRIIAAIVELSAARGNRSLLLAPRLEILDQLAREVRLAGLPVRSIHADRDEGPADAPVIIASIWTLATPRWLARLPDVQLVVIDECHRARSSSYRAIIAAYPRARLLGTTATPARGDGRALGDVFDELVVGPSVAELTAAGHLVPCWLRHPPSDTGKLALTVVEAYQRHVPGQLAIVFAAGIAHAQQVLADLSATGVRAGIVTDKTSDRERIATTQRFARGEIRVLVNVACFVEGFDVPACSAAILARGFSHVGPYLQALGRILRPYPGKTLATAIDLIGSSLEFGGPEVPREYSLTGRGIRSGAVRDQIRQCASCGSIGLAGPTACPYCGTAYPVRHRRAVSSDGRGLVDDGGAAAPRREFVVTIISKYGGTCVRCRALYRRGDRIRWATLGRQASHVSCPVGLEVAA